MKLLVLGGTQFLGRHIVQGALDRGWTVTMFNRGQTRPELFPGVERIAGNRDGGMGVLAGRRWDAVIDPSGYVPRIVRQSAKALADAVEHYTFISTISVYAEPKPGMDENAALATLPDPASEDVSAHYGALKALCELAVREEVPERALIIRPGLIVGPHDPTGRFTYWPLRIARGGRVLAPRADAPVQIIDARDLAAWTLDLTEKRVMGIFNGTSPQTPLQLGELLEQCRAALKSEAQFVHADDAFLEAQKIGPWIELPLWMPGPEGLLSVDVSKAFASGLRCRSVGETALDTFASYERGETPMPEGAGLKAEKEAAALAALTWRQS